MCIRSAEYGEGEFGHLKERHCFGWMPFSEKYPTHYYQQELGYRFWAGWESWLKVFVQEDDSQEESLLSE